MKKWLSAVAPLAAITSLALTGAAWAGNADDFGCSNATLKGEYAFGVTAYTPAPSLNIPTEVVTGIKVFDGQGNLTQRDYVGDNLAGPDFAPPGQETATYQVNSDCTGSEELDQNVPVSSGSTGVIKTLFVISDGGRSRPRGCLGVHSAWVYHGTRADPDERRRLEGRLGAGRLSTLSRFTGMD